MEYFPSRQERRQMRFKYRADRGLFNCEETLYNSEVRKLIANGFSVVKMTEVELKRGLGFYLVSWEKPYGSYVPQEVEEYIAGKGDYPFEHIKTNAQSLYVITAQASI